MPDAAGSVRSSQRVMGFMDKLTDGLPGFSGVFDEETFLAFAFVFTCVVFAIGLFLSQRTCIKSCDPSDKPTKRRKPIKKD